MDFTLHPSFKPFYKCAFLSFLPPYTYNHKIGYFTTFAIFLYISRAMPLFISEKEVFAEMFTMVVVSVQSLLRGLVFLSKKQSFDNFSKCINKYIQDNKHNSIMAKEDYFLKIWKNHYTFKRIKWFLIIFSMVQLSWQVPVFYDMATNLNNVTLPYYPLYSPYFDYNSYTKIGYTIMDVGIDWILAFNYIHNEMAHMSFLSFLHSQYLYLKQVLDRICVEKENDSQKIKWWIENHCLVIR